MKNVWDYDIKANWKPKTDAEWQWFLVRKINHDDYTGLKKEIILKYLPKIAKELDPGKRAMFEHYLKYENPQL